MFDPNTPPPQTSQPPLQTAPPKPRRKPLRWRLFADVIAFATAILSLTLAIFAGTSRDEARDEAASLADQIAALDSEIASLSDERDRLQDDLAATPTTDSTTDAGTDGGPAVGSEGEGAYVALDEAVSEEYCENYQSWVPSTLQIDGEEYFEGFQCDMERGGNSTPPMAYLDFVVPNDAVRLTGLAGIDDRSTDDTMVVKFSVLTVPESEEPLFTATLAYGDGAEAFDIPLGETGRVRFQVEVASSDHPDPHEPAVIGWADVRFE